MKCVAVVEWPKAIHEGNGKAAFVVDPATTDKQIEMLAQIFTGKLGGLPWELCGQGTFKAKAGGLSLDFDKTNWICYEFDWSNMGAAAAA